MGTILRVGINGDQLIMPSVSWWELEAENGPGVDGNFIYTLYIGLIENGNLVDAFF